MASTAEALKTTTVWQSAHLVNTGGCRCSFSPSMRTLLLAGIPLQCASPLAAITASGNSCPTRCFTTIPARR
ncbi:hypothetical protein BU26DRAFT_135284 [Trematosphaeria pertusa]|uniref:Uncharacterized protein n=1 Tax=Trematosphaeria pertusa TaxID=390896 RepID=A0A6A6IVH4_9PLEO|nr:uncharacterized protein BU26DRAFT_135284 [Trematosphaeria pertusa]KAF2254248.1 hypothetical protein BU26DRAFT_135284 [Trematosphaeria pertusa]